MKSIAVNQDKKKKWEPDPFPSWPALTPYPPNKAQKTVSYVISQHALRGLQINYVLILELEVKVYIFVNLKCYVKPKCSIFIVNEPDSMLGKY